jgi:hypothetical protein
MRVTYILGPALAGLLIAVWGAPDRPAHRCRELPRGRAAGASLRPGNRAGGHGGAGHGEILAGLKFLARDPFLRPLTAAQVISQTAFQALVISLPVLAFAAMAGAPGSPASCWRHGEAGPCWEARCPTGPRRGGDLVRTGELAWLLQALPMWLLAGSVPAGVAAALLAASGLGNGFRVPATQALALMRTPPPSGRRQAPLPRRWRC